LELVDPLKDTFIDSNPYELYNDSGGSQFSFA